MVDTWTSNESQGRARTNRVAFAAIGGSRASDGIGWVFSTVQPLTHPVSGLALTYGLRMDEVVDAPPRIDFAEPDARDIALSFASGPGLEVLQKYSLEKLANMAELDYAASATERSRKLHWLLAPAWRVILNTDSPEAPAQEALSWAKANSHAEVEQYFTEFLAHWRAGSSAEVHSFLTKHRDRLLNELI